MKTLFLSFFLLFGVLISAHAKNKTTRADTTINKVTKTERDGSSFDKAIIIAEKTEGAGEKAEYAWIATRYPGYKTNSQSLTYHNKTPFDIIHIITSDGKEVAVYFDIPNFYGKF